MQKHLLVITIISFLAGVIAPACNFMWGGKNSIIEICTTDGIEQRIITADGTSIPAPTQIKHDQCSFCFQSNNIVGDLSKTLKVEPIIYAQHKHRINLYTVVRLNKFKTPQSLRGPPLLS